MRATFDTFRKYYPVGASAEELAKAARERRVLAASAQRLPQVRVGISAATAAMVTKLAYEVWLDPKEPTLSKIGHLLRAVLHIGAMKNAHYGPKANMTQYAYLKAGRNWKDAADFLAVLLGGLRLVGRFFGRPATATPA